MLLLCRGKYKEGRDVRGVLLEAGHTHRVVQRRQAEEGTKMEDAEVHHAALGYAA